ncbi:MAG: MFS transporter [Parasporobacterium sp.]|nr:MFS transporter [Parasporobacterium sp.]
MAEAKRKGFLKYGILLAILGIFLMFFYAGLSNDQINIIQAFVTDQDGGSGWSTTMTQLPMTVGSFLCIILTFVFGSFFVKWGVKMPLIIVTIITALGTLGIAAANGLNCNGGVESGNYILFFVSLLITKCGSLMLQLAGFQLIACWFIKGRGQMMGIITLGSPLFSVCGTSVSTSIIAKNFAGDYRGFYIGMTIILVIIAIVVALFIKNTPEDVNLYPDGANEAPKSEAEEKSTITLGQVLRQGKSWLLIISYGCFVFVINACMGSMTVRYMSLGGLDVWLTATKYLALGAGLGIPMSYVFGVLDDKIGSVKTSIILGLTELIPVIALLTQPEGGSPGLMLLWGFGVACMAGGVPTMHPCITAYVYGRKDYAAASRIVMAIQLIPSAFAAMLMVTLISAGKANVAYGILLTLIAIGLIATIFMLKIKDANLADRSYGKKSKQTD